MMKNVWVLLLCLLSFRANAQLTETQGWLFITHQQKLSKKFDLLADVQTRSANELAYLTTLLLRGAVSYNINTKNVVAAGYAYKADWEQEELLPTRYTHENRIYQQYLYTSTIHRTEVSLRARLEQRWVNDEGINFSQRARAFISLQIPLAANSSFNKGWYVGLQNELFLNVQHKARVNKTLFDQNRSFASVGYRFNSNIDMETGYLYWYQKEMENSFRRNVIQLMITTSF